MSGKRSKREFLHRTDHRLDMSPVGRNLFVSREKQAQSQSAQRLRLWMRVVAVLAAVAAAGAVIFIAAFTLLPWFREELAVTPKGGGQQESSAASGAEEPLASYDSLGLPIYGDEVCLKVVNSGSPAQAGQEPELQEVCGVQADVHLDEALRLLSSAAKEEGLALVFTEGYVSYEEQEKRFRQKVKELEQDKGLSAVMAKTEAKATVPAPGESDFQSGLCLRLDGDPATFKHSRTYSWLKANMGKYGFVFRYPEYKEGETGVEPDLTVIRYVGGAHAAAMQQRSMCLEEYLDYLDSQ